MRLLDGTGNCANRALARTSRTALTLFRIDDVAQQALADAGGALLVNDVSNILVPEVLQGGQDRVGSRLAEGAQRGALDMVAQLFQLVVCMVDDGACLLYTSPSPRD